jgi:hypothetical protein
MKLLGTKKTFLILGEIMIYKDHFCQGAKMYKQSFRLGFWGRNGSDQHRFCIGKILHQFFPLKTS